MRPPQIVVAAVWVVLILAVGASLLHFGALTTNDVKLPGTGSQQASDVLRREFPPQQNGSSAIVFHISRGKLTDPANQRAVQSALAAMRKQPHVNTVTSPFTRVGSSLLSHDGATAVAQVVLNVNGSSSPRASPTASSRPPTRRAAPACRWRRAVRSSGAAIAEDNSRRSEAIGVAAAIVILAVTFGAMVAAGLPIVTALLGLAIGLSLVELFPGHVVSVPTWRPNWPP